MADETIVDETQTATETKETVDFNKEYEEEVNRIERAEHNRNGFQLRKQRQEPEDAEDDKITKAAEKILERVLPQLEASTASIALESQINQMTTDTGLKKLIRHHFENTISPTAGSLSERLELAEAAALRKVYKKQANELNLAISNRSQISNVGMGSNNQPLATPKDNILSENQLNELKRRGWDDKKIESLKKNLIKNRAS